MAPTVFYRAQEHLGESRRLNQAGHESLNRLTKLGFADDCGVLGEIVYRCAYPAGGPIDSMRLFQAAILLPDGLGVVQWDSVDYGWLISSPVELAMAAKPPYIRFDKCNSGLKALVLTHAVSMVGRLLSAFELIRAQPVGSEDETEV